MPNPYSYDFRQKVIEAIELNGLKKSETSELFNISRNTIDLWLKRKAETGGFQASANQPPGHNHKITDWQAFRSFVKISARTISRALHKIGFTRKKRPMATGNGTSPNGKHLLLR